LVAIYELIDFGCLQKLEKGSPEEMAIEIPLYSKQNDKPYFVKKNNKRDGIIVFTCSEHLTCPLLYFPKNSAVILTGVFSLKCCFRGIQGRNLQDGFQYSLGSYRQTLVLIADSQVCNHCLWPFLQDYHHRGPAFRN
jgi:hypothetical protein